eukprot:GCRY01002438.1.p1 GENE.GCRY01002438.1~~GCRY01002438.1.p1  ORF type:complete len:430 (-),score=89.14 GCRY01002438.1:43-1332(-)
MTDASVESESSFGKGLYGESDSTEIMVQQNDPNSPLFSVSSFEDMKLNPLILKGLHHLKFNKPSKIQENAIPMIIAEPPRNLIGQSQSGTGKTAAFCVGMLSRVDPSLSCCQALCLSPTRELASQLKSVCDQIGQFTEVKTHLAVRLNFNAEKPGFKKVAEQIIIGTPGRILDMMKKKEFDAQNIKIFVLDEADVMIDMQGLGDVSMRIKKLLRRDCQILLFSATFKEAVRKYALQMVTNPNIIQVKKEELSLKGIKQYYVDCEREDKKLQTLSDLYSYLTVGQSIVFVQRRSTADYLERSMRNEGHTVVTLHGEHTPQDRDTIMNQFRKGEAKVLITTNVLARGIDVLQVSLIINYDIPVDGRGIPDPETYIHRIGRSGRFGRKGVAVNFVHDKESFDNLSLITNHFSCELEELPLGDPDVIEKALLL